ncbi:transposase, partial [Peptococcaceae bacterium]|nr:transposase [Peptococcaceae bacterium]
HLLIRWGCIFMPRQARTRGEFSTYHIIQRGNERKNIFKSERDKIRFLETLSKMKKKYNFLVYGYCLMDNHTHLIIYDNGNDISKVIKSINISYVYYFNNTYKRSGHLFQDRFKSELIIDDNYLLQVSKYIHNNPVKTEMVKTPAEYKWSSYNIYTEKAEDKYQLVSKDKILEIISKNRTQAIVEYTNYVLEPEEDLKILEVDEDLIITKKENHNYIDTIEQARKKITSIGQKRKQTFEDMINNKETRDKLIKMLRKNSSLTLKEIGKLFGGMSESRVSRIAKE